MSFNEQEDCLNEIKEIELLYEHIELQKRKLRILQCSSEVQEYFALKKEVENFEWLEPLYKERLNALKSGTAETNADYLELIKKKF